MKSLRKIFAYSLSMILILSGCASQETNETADAPQEKEAVTEQTDENINADDTETDTAEGQGKYLVIYFSRTGEQYNVGTIDKGNTEIVAEMIAEKTGADTFEIVPKNDNYPMTFDALCDVAKEEQNNNARPEIKDTVKDFDSYSTVYLGYPIWWADLPMPVYSFFEEYDFSGKNIYVFITHEGSGYSSTVKTIRELEPDANVVEARSVKGGSVSDEENSIREFVKEQLSK